MSHAHATFVFADGTKLYGEYNGTADVMLPVMLDSKDEVLDGWRVHEWKECDCVGGRTACIAHTEYGGGFWWHGEACLSCRVFIGPQCPYGNDFHLGEASPEIFDSEHVPGANEVTLAAPSTSTSEQ